MESLVPIPYKSCLESFIYVHSNSNDSAYDFVCSIMSFLKDSCLAASRQQSRFWLPGFSGGCSESAWLRGGEAGAGSVEWGWGGGGRGACRSWFGACGGASGLVCISLAISNFCRPQLKTCLFISNTSLDPTFFDLKWQSPHLNHLISGTY